MIGYAFLPKQTKDFYKPVYSCFLDALNWATGEFLYKVNVPGNTAKEKGGIVSDSMLVLGRIDSTDVLRHFARMCALESLSQSHASVELPGIWQWLNNNKKPITWKEMLVWAKDTEMLWMNGGHVEASICNALLSYCPDRQVWYHSWKSAAHAQMLLGKTKEVPRQIKSLKQSLNRELSYVV